MFGFFMRLIAANKALRQQNAHLKAAIAARDIDIEMRDRTINELAGRLQLRALTRRENGWWAR